jgi:hypothetical protein
VKLKNLHCWKPFQQAGKCLAGAVVVCELWRLAVAPHLLVVPCCVYMWSINPFSNPNPVYSHVYYVTLYNCAFETASLWEQTNKHYPEGDHGIFDRTISAFALMNQVSHENIGQNIHTPRFESDMFPNTSIRTLLPPVCAGWNKCS